MKDPGRLIAHILILYFVTIASMAFVLGMRVFAYALGLTEEKIYFDLLTGGFVNLVLLSVVLFFAWRRKKKTGKYELGVNPVGLFLCVDFVVFWPPVFILWAGLDAHYALLKDEEKPLQGFGWFCWLMPVIGSALVFFWQAKAGIAAEGASAAGLGMFALIMLGLFWYLCRDEKPADLPKAQVHNR